MQKPHSNFDRKGLTWRITNYFQGISYQKGIKVNSKDYPRSEWENPKKEGAPPQVWLSDLVKGCGVAYGMQEKLLDCLRPQLFCSQRAKAGVQGTTAGCQWKPPAEAAVTFTEKLSEAPTGPTHRDAACLTEKPAFQEAACIGTTEACWPSPSTGSSAAGWPNITGTRTEKHLWTRKESPCLEGFLFALYWQNLNMVPGGKEEMITRSISGMTMQGGFGAERQ